MSKSSVYKKFIVIVFSVLLLLNYAPITSYASNENAVSPTGIGDARITYENKTFIKTVTNKFVSYADSLTPYWTYAREYEVRAGQTIEISANLTYKNAVVGVSYSYENDSSTYIPANSSKLSKLAFYDDFNVYRYSVYQNETDGTKRFIGYNYDFVRIPGKTRLVVKYK